ncbi:IclR family transcriptional regulator [Halorientalis marina]|jgi:DNA-binding IclR family transcriptional regulator|uniref:IclR family transcriptional regulator n=1 Tax=Halorientalis marina TaxID=2931976 RepID=UPI001FF11652|nr:IclR family transcriptional regulator [Halorientalis marina]
MGKSDPPLRTVARAFEIVEVLWETDGVGSAELSERLDIPKSTAHDYLRTLEDTGYAVRRDNKYQLGFQFLSVGGRLRNQNRFFQAARSEVRRLAIETGELPNIGVEENGEGVLLHAVRGDKSLELGLYPGMRIPLHSNGAGKALFAHLPEEEIAEMLERGEFEQMTEHTITDPDELAEELEAVRERGYAVARDEQVLGMATVSVPIHVDESLVGVLSISTPTGRLEDEAYETDLVQQLQEAANTIMVGYQYGP